MQRIRRTRTRYLSAEKVEPRSQMSREDQREILILFSPYEYLLTVYTNKQLVLDYNKQLNCTCWVNLIQADCIIVLLDIIDCKSIIVKVNLKARGFTEFTRLTLPFHILHLPEKVQKIYCPFWMHWPSFKALKMAFVSIKFLFLLSFTLDQKTGVIRK